jgi:hypothetical protein
VHFTDFVLGSDWKWNYDSIKPNFLYVINSQQELLPRISKTWYNAPLPDIDFSQYSLLFTYGNTDSLGITSVSKNLQQLSTSEYILDIDVDLNDATIAERWIIAILVRKICAENYIGLDTTISRQHIRVCDTDDPLTELAWIGIMLQDSIMGLLRVYQCAYKDGIGFLFEYDRDVGRDGGLEFKTCEARTLCDFWSHIPYYCERVWGVDIKSKKLIWEISR